MSAHVLYDNVRISDEAVAKALRVSEVAQIARAELRLRQFLLSNWNRFASQASNRAGSMARQGKSARIIAAETRKVMNGWPKSVLPTMQRELRSIYRLARTAGWKKGTGQTRAALTYDTPNLTEMQKAAPAAGFEVLPSFNIQDTKAMDALAGHQVFWVGDHYDENISAAVANTTRETILEVGSDRVAAGKLMKERIADKLSSVRTPTGFHGSAEQYFEGLTANAATVSRAHGQMASFQEIEIARYAITNPLDERTCPVCVHMDGKTFSVEQGVSQAEAEVEAKDADDIKTIHPWFSKKELDKISKTPGESTRKDSKALADAGYSLPPFHFRCRCTVDLVS